MNNILGNAPAFRGFSPLPGFEGSGGWPDSLNPKPRKGSFSPLPGFEGSGGFCATKMEVAVFEFQSPSGV